MKRLHVFVLFFHSYFVYATPQITTGSSEMRPMASSGITASPDEMPPVAVGSYNSLPPRIRQSGEVQPAGSLSSDGWITIMQAMRATISEQTNEINDLKLRISIIESKLNGGGQ